MQKNIQRLKRLLLLLLITGSIILPHLSFSQIKHVLFEQLDSLQELERKPVVVFLYTSWCKYCGAMKNTTFKDMEVVKLLQQEFYFVAMDIEEKANILFRGHTFKFKPTGAGTGVHELAEQLGSINGEIGYPTICFLNSNYEIIHQRQGFVPVKEMISLLTHLKRAINN